MCACDVHAHHDITRFAYEANHVTMMSPVFTFHSCHLGKMWHDIIGVHVVGTPCIIWDDVAMTSSCSHCIHITLMMSSCLVHDVTVTHMNHDFSHGA